MRLIEDKVTASNCIAERKEFKIECDYGDAQIIRQAEAIIKRIKKLCKIDESMADMTQIKLSVRKNIVTVESLQGAIG